MQSARRVPAALLLLSLLLLPTALAAPPGVRDLRADFLAQPDRVWLTWHADDAAGAPTGFRVLVASDASNEREVARVPASERSMMGYAHTHDVRHPGPPGLRFAVVPVGPEGEGPRAEVALSRPGAPSVFSAWHDDGRRLTAGVTRWVWLPPEDDGNAGVAGYRLYRNATDGPVLYRETGPERFLAERGNVEGAFFVVAYNVMGEGPPSHVQVVVQSTRDVLLPLALLVGGLALVAALLWRRRAR